MLVGVSFWASATGLHSMVPAPFRRAFVPPLGPSSHVQSRRAAATHEPRLRLTTTQRLAALPLRMGPDSAMPDEADQAGDGEMMQNADKLLAGRRSSESTVEAVGSVSMGSQPRSDLWGNWTEHEVKVATLLWIEKFVIGMKLCPFAVDAMNGLRLSVSDSRNRDTALDKIDVELKWIVGLDKASPACTLMVYPPALFERGGSLDFDTSPLCTFEDDKGQSKENEDRAVTDCEGFDGFMSLATDAREMAQGFNAAHGQDIDTETLLLTFHPTSTFSAVADDPADFALRSPFPTILILRGTDVREAEDLCDIQGRVTEDIAIANEARLRTVGYDKLRDMFHNIMNSTRSPGGEATRELSLIQAERENAMFTEAASADLQYGDGFDGLETETLSKDPVGWFPPPREVHGGLTTTLKPAGGEDGEKQEEGALGDDVAGQADETAQRGGRQGSLSDPFDPLGYGPPSVVEPRPESRPDDGNQPAS